MTINSLHSYLKGKKRENMQKSYAGLSGFEIANMPVEQIYNRISNNLTREKITFDAKVTKLLAQERAE